MADAPRIRITEYTDPGCPWAWSAEPFRARVAWLYGDDIGWDLRLVGLHDEPQRREDGYEPDVWAERFRDIAREHGMPIDSRPREHMAATVPACRLVVAAKVHRPEAARALLRRLRVRNWRGEQLDAAQTLQGAAADAGVDAAELTAWQDDPAVDERLRADMAAAREPLPAARALDHKLANWSGGRRYTCPSWEIERPRDGVKIAVPGFQPFAAYDVVLANLCPGMQRRDDAQSAREVLEWSSIELSTREVAAVMDADPYVVREELARTARLEPVGADGFWSLGG